jgi:hypothetical protein
MCETCLTFDAGHFTRLMFRCGYREENTGQVFAASPVTARPKETTLRNFAVSDLIRRKAEGGIVTRLLPDRYKQPGNFIVYYPGFDSFSYLTLIRNSHDHMP